MKVLIPIVIGFVVVGCATIPVKELTLKENIVGAYEINRGGRDGRMVLHENGKGNASINKKPRRPFIWKTYGKEVHFDFPDGDPNIDFYIYVINPDNSLTYTAVILIDGKRIDGLPEEAVHTYKKIK